MFRKLTIMVAVLLLTAAPALAWGPSLIGGAGVGYGLTGPDDGRTFVVQYAGAKILTLDQAAVYLCYQHGGIEGVSGVGGNGGRAILASSFRAAPAFSALIGIGFLENLQPDGTSLDAGLTADGGLSYDVSDWIEAAVYGMAWDRGDRASWAITFSLIVKDPQRIIPGWGGE